jgi:hypothetical protein
MNIYSYLKKDHRKVARLFKNIIACRTNKERENIFLKLKRELELHADPEHHTFYAALRSNSMGEEDAEHGDDEHRKIKKYLAKLSKITPKETVKWLVHLGELKQIVEHHVEEEENNMFEDAKKIISQAESEDLVIKMEELKRKMMRSKSFINKFMP